MIGDGWLDEGKEGWDVRAGKDRGEGMSIEGEGKTRWMEGGRCRYITGCHEIR